MKKIKFLILISMWLSIKPLVIILDILLIGLWIYCAELQTWYGYILFAAPTIISLIAWAILFVKESYNGTWDEESGGWCFFVCFIPIVLFCLFTIMWSLAIPFPNKYDYQEIEDMSVIEKFVQLTKRI